MARSSCFVEECLMLKKLKITEKDYSLHFSYMN